VVAVQETWQGRDLPVLEAIVQAADEHGFVDVRNLDVGGLCPVRADIAVSGHTLHLILQCPDILCVSLPDVRCLIMKNARGDRNGGSGNNGRRA
jgi:hypothetical protein